MSTVQRPDAAALLADLEGARFVRGVIRGRWRLESIDFPHAFITVCRAHGPDVTLRFECSGYPSKAPTAQPWSLGDAGPAPASGWPTGSVRITSVFRPNWKGGTALYLPTDREALPGHPNWRAQHPHLLWQPDRGIVQYLEIVHDILH